MYAFHFQQFVFKKKPYISRWIHPLHGGAFVGPLEGKPQIFRLTGTYRSKNWGLYWSKNSNHDWLTNTPPLNNPPPEIAGLMIRTYFKTHLSTIPREICGDNGRLDFQGKDISMRVKWVKIFSKFTGKHDKQFLNKHRHLLGCPAGFVRNKGLGSVGCFTLTHPIYK